ncbi:MAG: hypothetical protein LBC93_00790 [Synergistaceae bacterium]|nr:hypothetical protein [Synergistaceae bacterium]
MRRLCWILLRALLLVLFTARVPWAAESQDVRDILEERKDAAFRHIQELAVQNIAQAEEKRIMSDLDAWHKRRLTRIMEEHHAKVESVLADVTLGEDVGGVEVYWSQIKAGAGFDATLADLVQRFADRVQRAVRADIMELQERISGELHQKLMDNIILANSNIWGRYNLAMGQVFGKELVSSVAAAPSLESVLESVRGRESEGANAAGQSPTALALGIGIIMLPLIKRIVNRVSTAIAVKMGGKIVSKLIPVVGWLMVGWEIWSATQAKANLEEELRKNFFTEYKQSFSAEVIWQEIAASSELRDTVKRSCLEIENQCRAIAASFIDISDIVQRVPVLREYVQREREDGRGDAQIYDTLKQLYYVFKDKILSEYDVKVLEQVVFRVPPAFRGRFSRLLDVTGNEFVELFIQDRVLFDERIRKAQLLGVENYLRHRTEVDLLKDDLQTVFVPYASFITEDAGACAGVFLLLRLGASTEGWQQEALRRVFAHGEAFAAILPQDQVKAVKIFQSDRMAGVLLRAYEKNPELSRALVKLQPLAFWDTARKIENTLSAIEFVKKESRYSPEEAVAAVMSDARIPDIYEEYGKDGLVLWRRFVGKDSGTQQEKIAKSAIQLALHKGYPTGKLITINDVKWAEYCDYLPIGGVSLFGATTDLSQGLRFAILYIPLFVFLYLAARFFYKILRLHQGAAVYGGFTAGRTPLPEKVIEAEILPEATKQDKTTGG